MKKNMGGADRIIRILLAVVVGILYWQEMINGTAAIILGVISIVFLLTSFISFCPLYAAVGLSTKSAQDK